MPLSEHEQRLLEQMERALYAEDPKLASALRGADPRAHYRRRIVLASAAFVVGTVLVVTGLVTRVIAVSVAGFVVMLGAAFVALSSRRQRPGPGELGAVGGTASRSVRGGTRKSKGKPGFMERFEARWSRRRDENGR